MTRGISRLRLRARRLGLPLQRHHCMRTDFPVLNRAYLHCFYSSTVVSDSPPSTKFRETRLYHVAPISTNLILACVAEHVLGLPRSF